MIGAFFYAYVIVKKFENYKNRSILSVLKIYLHRYIRFLPLYVCCIVFQIYMLPRLSDGPQYFTTKNGADSCRENWYANLLFINNLFHNDNKCMSWTWYLSMDFQFFLLVPFIVWIAYKSKKMGIFTLIGLAICSLISQIVVICYYKLGISISYQSSKGEILYDTYYERPYCRIIPYLLGIGLAFLIWSEKKRRKELRNHLFNECSFIL